MTKPEDNITPDDALEASLRHHQMLEQGLENAKCMARLLGTFIAEIRSFDVEPELAAELADSYMRLFLAYDIETQIEGEA